MHLGHEPGNRHNGRGRQRLVHPRSLARDSRERSRPAAFPVSLVFPSTVGTPLNYRNLVRAFKDLLKRASLPQTVRLYDLRHSCATLLLSRNVHPRYVQELLGHAHIWNGFGDPKRAGHKSRILDDWCERVRCYPREIERSTLIQPNQIQNADGYIENGITHLMLGFGGPDYDLSPLEELVAWRDSRKGGSSANRCFCSAGGAGPASSRARVTTRGRTE